jgi:hypothetical protein
LGGEHGSFIQPMAERLNNPDVVSTPILSNHSSDHHSSLNIRLRRILGVRSVGSITGLCIGVLRNAVAYIALG